MIYTDNLMDKLPLLDEYLNTSPAVLKAAVQAQVSSFRAAFPEFDDEAAANIFQFFGNTLYDISMKYDVDSIPSSQLARRIDEAYLGVVAVFMNDFAAAKNSPQAAE